MTSTILATVHMPMIGGTPLDATSNSFCFVADDATSATIDVIEEAIEDFYNDTATGAAHPIGFWLGAQIDRSTNAIVVKYYDVSAHLDGSPHGSPIAMRTFSLAGADGVSDLPQGVCSVLTIHSAYGSDVEFGTHARPRARDRGRVYFGPLVAPMKVDDGTTNRVSIGSAALTTFTKAALSLLTDAALVAAGIGWNVWSRKNASTKIVTGGWMDDRFDYQRRREDPGLLRTVWP